MKIQLSLFIIILNISIVFFCSSQEENFTVEIIEGVRYVYNNVPQWRDKPKVAFEFVQKIGGLDATDENFILYRPNDVEVDGEGNIYILDTGDYRVQKYDKQGKYLLTIGRQGLGPGEFARPTSIQVYKDYHLYVVDNGKGKTIELDQNGKEIRNIWSDAHNIFKVLVLQSDEFLVEYPGVYKTEIGSESRNLTETLLKIVDNDFNLLREFCTPLKFEDYNVDRQMNIIFYTFDKDDNIYVSFYHQNRIEKYTSEGKLVWKADRKLSYKQSKPGKSEEKREEGPIAGETIVTIRMDTMNKFSYNIAVDGKGRSWVHTFTKQAEGKIRNEDYIPAETMLEIYDPEGILLGRLPFPNVRNISTYRIFGDRMFFIDREEEMAVYEYRIIEK